MNTGTPLDLTPFGSILSAVGILYWVIAIGLLTLALRRPATWQGKALASCVVVAVFGWLPVTYGWEEYKANKKLSKAVAKFEELCKTAGPKIYMTANNVDGIFLENVRPKLVSGEQNDKNWPNAGLAQERNGDGYIKTFLYWEHDKRSAEERGYLNGKPSEFPGFKYVETGVDGGYVRYTFSGDEIGPLIEEKIEIPRAKYSVSYFNDVDPGKRDLWIAGVRVVINDRLTGKLMAEHQWYSLDIGQGSTAGFRRPWDSPSTCPSYVGWSAGKTRFFVDKVLNPLGEKHEK